MSAKVDKPRPTLLPPHPSTRHPGVMPDRPFPAVDALIRRVQRVAAERPDPTHILAEVISMIGASEADPYVVLGVLMEGAAHMVAHHIPTERQAATTAELVKLLRLGLKVHGL
jgi:hypothetical protein